MASSTQNLQTTLIKFYQKPVARVSLELFLSIGAIVFFAVFAIRPTLLTMSDLIKEIEDKRQLDTQLGQKIAALSTVQPIYLSTQDQLSILDEAIPPHPELEEALKMIEKLASENQLVITAMQVNEIPKEKEEDVPFTNKERLSIPINASVTGSYESIRSFIEALRQTRRAFIVDRVVFSVSQERGLKILRATIAINLQYYGESTTTTNRTNRNTNSESML